MTTSTAQPHRESRRVTIEIAGVTGAGKSSLLHILGRYLREQGFPVDLEDNDHSRLHENLVAETLDEEIAEADLARFKEGRMHHPITLRTRLVDDPRSPRPADEPAD